METLKQKIAYIDGRRLKRAVIAGGSRLIQLQEHLDRINVFPVPDHDTGTNMAITFRGIIDSIGNVESSSISKIAEEVADASILHAQGNSGAIIAQFFQGFSRGVSGFDRIGTLEFAHAVREGCFYARESVSKPEEGTILTVIDRWAENVKINSEKTGDFKELLEESLVEIKIALKKTVNQLETLRKSGVVDAGAQGFVYIIEGIIDFIKNGKIETYISGEDTAFSYIDKPQEDTEFRYCTECVLTGENLSKSIIKKELEKIGNSVVIAGNNRKLHLHLHTNRPDEMIERLFSFGLISQEKVDDMHRQYIDVFSRRADIAIVTDSTCDLPDELMDRYNIHVVPLKVNFGERSYLDKWTLKIEEFYEKLKSQKFHPRTSQPSPGDFIRVYQFLVNNYRHVISIHISSMLSGTYQSACMASLAFKDRITVIDSKSASIGLGLIVLSTAKAIEKGYNLEEVKRITEEAIRRVKLYLVPETLNFLVKGGRINRTIGFLGEIFNIKPIFLVDGKIKVIKKVISEKKAHMETMKLLKKETCGKEKLKFIIGIGNSPDKAMRYKEEILQNFKPEEIYLTDISSVIATHVGPGAAGVAFIEEVL